MNSNSPPNLLQKLLKIFSNPMWNSIGVFVAILIFIATYQSQGSLVFELIDTSPLVQQEDVSGDLKLLYNDQPVNKPFSIIYFIKNTGGTTIGVDDYQGNITIDFGAPSKILNAFVYKTEPSTLKDTIEREGIINVPSSTPSKIEVKPLILNSGDSITLKAIVDNFNLETLGSPIARVAKIKKIEQSYSSIQKPMLCLPITISQPKWLVFSFIVGLSCLLALLAKLTLSSLASRSKLTLFMASFTLVLSMLGAATLIFG
jgi:hypothetical protein